MTLKDWLQWLESLLIRRDVRFEKSSHRRFYTASYTALMIWGIDCIMYGKIIFSAPNYAGFDLFPPSIWGLMLIAIALYAWMVAKRQPKRGLFCMSMAWCVITILFALGAWYSTAVIAYGFITYLGLRTLRDVS